MRCQKWGYNLGMSCSFCSSASGWKRWKAWSMSPALGASRYHMHPAYVFFYSVLSALLSTRKSKEDHVMSLAFWPSGFTNLLANIYLRYRSLSVMLSVSLSVEGLYTLQPPKRQQMHRICRSNHQRTHKLFSEFSLDSKTRCAIPNVCRFLAP